MPFPFSNCGAYGFAAYYGADDVLGGEAAPEAPLSDVVEMRAADDVAVLEIPVRVNGRGKLSCVAVVPWPGMVELRLQDASNPEFWCNVGLDLATLERFLELANYPEQAG